jgi:hypothetical protein
MTTLAFGRYQRPAKTFFVLLHTAEAPDEAEWQAYVEAVRATMSAPTTDVDVFILTDGGSPDAQQRKDLAAVVAGASRDAVKYIFTAHIFTADPFVRAVVSAFRWLGAARAFAYPPVEFGNVCARCGVPRDDVMTCFVEVQRSLPRVLFLDRLAEEAASSSVPTPR